MFNADDKPEPARVEATKRSALIWIATLMTLGIGVANLYSVARPPAYHRLSRLLQEALPLEWRHAPRSATLLLGLALVISAINIYRRKRRAFQIVLPLALGSFFLNLVSGHHYAQAALSSLLVGVLLQARHNFTVRSRRPDVRLILLRLAVAVGAAFSYGVAGFWLLDEREFAINFHWSDSIVRTMRYLTLMGDPALAPHTQHAAWFLDSLYLVTSAVIVYAVVSLFRPILYRIRMQPLERARAEQVIARHGRSSLDYFKTWPDKSYFFSSTGNTVVAYGVGSNFAVALGDPVAPEGEIETTIAEFRRYCEDNGWGVGFHQTLPDFLPAYQRQGFKKLKIGDDALVDLTSFNLNGTAAKRLRKKVNQLEKSGIHVCQYAPPVPAAVIAGLRKVSDEWLQIPGRRERAFTLGRFEPDYVRSTAVLTAEDERGRVLAFVNLIPSHHAGEATIDLMRHRRDAPNGVMDYLFAKIFLHCRAQGFTRFNLGMAPMSGFQPREQASAAERAVHAFFQRLNFLFSFAGLKQFKGKFATSWEPRYVVYRNVLDLPRFGLALSRVSKLDAAEAEKITPEEKVDLSWQNEESNKRRRTR